MNNNEPQIIGNQPTGRATGNERWIAVYNDDETIVITLHHGWLEASRVTLSGVAAVQLRDTVIDNLLHG